MPISRDAKSFKYLAALSFLAAAASLTLLCDRVFTPASGAPSVRDADFFGFVVLIGFVAAINAPAIITAFVVALKGGHFLAAAMVIYLVLSCFCDIALLNGFVHRRGGYDALGLALIFYVPLLRLVAFFPLFGGGYAVQRWTDL